MPRGSDHGRDGGLGDRRGTSSWPRPSAPPYPLTLPVHICLISKGCSSYQGTCFFFFFFL
jgi:hypothetical protein